jgi:hypothetical protein
MGKHLSHATQECVVMQREEMELLAVRATLWRMEIELLREIHRYRFASRRLPAASRRPNTRRRFRLHLLVAVTGNSGPN